MRALTWHGRHDVRVDDHPEPRVEAATDAVVDVTACAICGSDLHLYHGFVPKMREGDVLGHEFTGVVRETGAAVEHLAEGDRVVVPFPIACGACENCQAGLYAQCWTTNRGHGAAIFGYSHLYGGVPGGQAEAVRVPHADVGPQKVPDGVTDAQAVMLSDVLPTGYQAVAQTGLGTDALPFTGVADEVSVAVFGCGPVGLMAVLSAKRLLGADRVIAVDRLTERLTLARSLGADATINFGEEADPAEAVRAETEGGRGAHVSVDAVGFEASSHRRVASAVEKMAGALLLQTGSLTALRWTVAAARQGGAVSVPGVYAVAPAQQFPWGRLWEKGLTVHTGQTHVQAHLPTLLAAVAEQQVDPGAIVTHRASLEEAPEMYDLFERKGDGCVKVVLEPR